MPNNKLGIDEMKSLAKSKGGQCLSTKYINHKSRLRWHCSLEHEFRLTPNAIKNQNRWCPQCTLENMRKALTKGPEHIMKVISEEAPQFPRKSYVQDRRRKLSEEQIEEIRHLRKMGLPLLKIAKKFGIAHQTVMYHTDPKGRKRRNKLAYLCYKERLARNPALRDKMKQARARYVQERLKEPGFRRYYYKVRNIRTKRNYYLKRERIPSSPSEYN
jgi:hypothetical protein